MTRPALLLALLAALAGCASGPVAIDPRVPLRLDPPTRRAESGGVHALEIAVRDYVPADGSGPTVRLVGAIHIGSRDYYAAVQRRLDAADLVLFEGVSQDPEDFKRSPAQRKKGHLYTKMADALGLVTQFEGIDYRRAHFRNADLSPEAMTALLDAEIAAGGPGGEAATAAKAQMGTLTKTLQGGGGMMGALANFMIGMVERSPKLRATLLLSLAGMDPDAAKSGGLMGGKGGARLGKLILEDRNAAALAALAPELRRGSPVRTVAVFYGAAHLPGIEDALIRLHGYVPGATEWITALSVNPTEAGLTPREVEQALSAGRKSRR